MVRAIARALVTEEAKNTPMVRFVANLGRKEVSEAAQQSIVIALPSTSPSPDLLSSSDDDRKKREPKEIFEVKEGVVVVLLERQWNLVQKTFDQDPARIVKPERREKCASPKIRVSSPG